MGQTQEEIDAAKAAEQAEEKLTFSNDSGERETQAKVFDQEAEEQDDPQTSEEEPTEDELDESAASDGADAEDDSKN